MTKETKILLFNYAIEEAKKHGVIVTNLFFKDIIRDTHDSICNSLEHYICEYDEEFCLLDKLGKTDYEVYAAPFKKVFKMWLVNFLLIKKNNPELQSEYVKSLAHEYIAHEYDRYMENTYHSLREERDYSREDKERLALLEGRRTIEGKKEHENYYAQMMKGNNRVYFYNGDPFVINLSAEDVKKWDKEKRNEELLQEMFNSYYLAGKAESFNLFPDECEIYKIRYFNKLSWEEYKAEREKSDLIMS